MGNSYCFHGGSDPGAVSGNLREKDFTLKAANYMYNRFKELGVPVAITRDDDTTLSRVERLNTMRNTFGNDSKVLVLSNHINAGGGEGAEIVYPLRTSSTLPAMILDKIGEKVQIKRKYYQRVLPEDPSKDYYYIMRETPNTTSLLIEYGFIDNPNDQRKLENNLLDYVEGVVEAVADYIGVNYTPSGDINKPEGIYTVMKGDTLYSIARKYNTTVKDLINLNGLTSNNLSIGQTLLVPYNEIIKPDIIDGYVVKSGDTLYSIARDYNVSVNDLIEYNNLPTTILSVGQVLQIPNIFSSDITYIVKPGDTLYKIANDYGVSVNDIKKLNNLNSNIISIGEKLIIPKGNTIEETDYIVYQVKPNDTLFSISRQYNTTPQAIMEYNNLTTNLLSINQILQIPVEKITSENTSYIVKSGDTLYKIANNYGVTVMDLMNLNNLNSTLINIGDVILIPNQTNDFR